MRGRCRSGGISRAAWLHFISSHFAGMRIVYTSSSRFARYKGLLVRPHILHQKLITSQALHRSFSTSNTATMRLPYIPDDPQMEKKEDQDVVERVKERRGGKLIALDKALLHARKLYIDRLILH